MCASCVTISNPESLSNSEARLYILVYEAETNAIIWMSSMSESHWWHHPFHKIVQSWECRAWFWFWQFQTPAWKRYLQIHSQMAEQFVFWRWWSRFSESRTSQDLSKGTSPLNSATFFCPHIYTLSLIYTRIDTRTVVSMLTWKNSKCQALSNIINVKAWVTQNFIHVSDLLSIWRNCLGCMKSVSSRWRQVHLAAMNFVLIVKRVRRVEPLWRALFCWRRSFELDHLPTRATSGCLKKSTNIGKNIVE